MNVKFSDLALQTMTKDEVVSKDVREAIDVIRLYVAGQIGQEKSKICESDNQKFKDACGARITAWIDLLQFLSYEIQ